MAETNPHLVSSLDQESLYSTRTASRQLSENLAKFYHRTRLILILKQLTYVPNVDKDLQSLVVTGDAGEMKREFCMGKP